MEKIFIGSWKKVFWQYAKSGDVIMGNNIAKEEASKHNDPRGGVFPLSFVCNAVEDFAISCGEEPKGHNQNMGEEICKNYCPFQFAIDKPCGHEDSMFNNMKKHIKEYNAENVGKFKRLAHDMASAKFRVGVEKKYEIVK